MIISFSPPPLFPAPLPSCPPCVVSLCLRALRHALPADVFLAMISSYYVASHLLPTSNMLLHFVQWMVSCVPSPGSQTQALGSSSKVGALCGCPDLVDVCVCVCVYVCACLGLHNTGRFECSSSSKVFHWTWDAEQTGLCYYLPLS